MRPVKTKFPYQVKSIENIFIPMLDGRKLACRMWIPENIDLEKVPAIFEYMPYRKRDYSRARDEAIHHYIAGHGYASIRVDTKGSGDSDGLLRGEWEQEELDDGINIIEWLTKQDWCSGSVGMIGKSWSGFSALALAGLAPHPLKAIVAVCAGDDRYNQSLHWTGGCFLNEQLWWNDSMLMFNARPPDPKIVGKKWRKMWKDRLKDNKPWLIEWLSHQTRDSYWKHASLCERYDKVKAAVFLVGGWSDYLSRAIPGMMQELKSPSYALIGPWGHHYPHDGFPGPAVGFLQDCVRFFDRHIKNKDNKWEKTSKYRVYLQSFSKPSSKNKDQPGSWISLEKWPSKNVNNKCYHLNPGKIENTKKPKKTLLHSSPLSTGLASTEWLSMNIVGEQPRDQREDDGRSLIFDSDPLLKNVDILGSINLDLEFSVNRPVAQIAVRICDVSPEGTSVRVTYQVFNLTHRKSNENPEIIIPDKRERIGFTLPDVGWTFSKGHIIRLALSTSFWPIVWPTPEPVIIKFFTGRSTITLPILKGKKNIPKFGINERGPEIEIEIVEPQKVERIITNDTVTGEIICETVANGGFIGPGRKWKIVPIDTVLGHQLIKRFSIIEGDPESAKVEFHQIYEIEKKNLNICIKTNTFFGCTKSRWILKQDLKAYENKKIIYSKTWSKKILRVFM